MSLLERIIVGSGIGVATLVLLFYIEDQRGRRFLPRVRTGLDYLVDWLVVRWHTIMLYIGSGAGRVGLHYLLHRVLRRTISWLEVTQAVVQRWLRRNRRMVRTVQASRTASHLTAIAEHKHATALSDGEKKDRKDRALEG